MNVETSTANEASPLPVVATTKPAIAKPAQKNKPKSKAKRQPKPLCQEGLAALDKAKTQGVEPMDKQTAGELAKSRGYGSSVNGFCQKCRADNPDEALNEFGIVYDRESQKYFDVRAIATPGD